MENEFLILENEFVILKNGIFNIRKYALNSTSEPQSAKV